MAVVKAKKKQGKLVIKVKEGALHKAEGIPQGQKLTAADKEIHPGDSALMRKRKTFAQNAAKWNHSGK